MWNFMTHMTSQIKFKNIEEQTNNYTDHNQIFKPIFNSKSVITLKISKEKSLCTWNHCHWPALLAFN